jgi:hypothetical protein
MAHIDTSEIIRAAVWIRPTGGALEKINKVVRLAHQHGGGPPVQPHVTLLSGMETTMASAGLKLKHLAARIKPFTVRLGAIEWRQDYYRCFYAKVGLSDELAAAQRDAYDAFEMKPAPPFEPHLSLLYGNVDEAVKKKLAADMGGKLDVAFECHVLHVVNASMGVPAADWHTLAEHALAHA